MVFDKFYLIIAILHIDANKFNDCLNIYTIITSTVFYLNKRICIILLIKISKTLQQETEAYSLTPSVAD